jgi:hypothetical protein
VNEFIDHLYTRLGTTSTYNAIADLITLQITTAHAKPFAACFAFTSRFLATVSNSGDSSASPTQIPSSQPPVQNSATLIAPTVLVITSRHGPHRKHRSSVVAFVSVATGKCLPSCCPETATARITENTVSLVFPGCMLLALPSNGRSLAGLYATILFSRFLVSFGSPNPLVS